MTKFNFLEGGDGDEYVILSQMQNTYEFHIENYFSKNQLITLTKKRYFNIFKMLNKWLKVKF